MSAPSPRPRALRSLAAVPAIAAALALCLVLAPSAGLAAGAGDVTAVSGLACVHERPWVCAAPAGTFAFRITLSALGISAIAGGLPFTTQGTTATLAFGLDPATLIAGTALPIRVSAQGSGILQLALGTPAPLTVYVGVARLPPWPGTPDTRPPAHNVAPPIVAGGVFASAQGQEAAYLKAIAAARRREGRPNGRLPRNFARLGPVDQLFVLTNLERVSRGLWPLWAVSPVLNADARAGAEARTDPVYRGDVAWGSNWFSGTDPAQAVFGWMYDDGPGPWNENVDCPRAGAGGCWGHRSNILGNWGPYGLFGGADVRGGGTTELMVSGVVPLKRGVQYTWAEAVRMGARPAN